MSETGRAETREISMMGRLSAAIAAIGVLCLAMAAMLAPAAGAETFGQVGSPWGSAGSGNAQFLSPGVFGVDPVDGSVYGGDVTSNNANYRIQKLSASGEFKGSVLLPRFEDEATKLIPFSLHGVAVDHERERIYVISGCKVTTGSSVCQKNTKVGTTFNAKQVLAFKTAPESEKLVSAGSFNLPEGTEELYQPQAIAVDPSNGDVVLMAEDSAKHIVIQRFSSAGTPGARFVDSSNTLKPATGREATSIAVSPEGITYTITGAPGSAGAKFTRAWELPTNLSSLKEVGGFAAAAEAEGWIRGLQAVKMPVLFGGPQLTISPDGSTLYWKENLTTSSESEAGAVLVRGYSLANKESTVLYGGGVSGTCQITTSSAGIGATGKRVVVFDYGAGGATPAYGDKVVTFGPGGSGCPIPTPKFTTNGGKVTEVTVTKGNSVAFDGKESELFGKILTGLEWNFGDGTIQKVVAAPCEEEGCEPTPPSTTTSHRFLKAGKYVVKLKISATEWGQLPAPAEVIVNVVGGKPTASFTASTTTPEAGGTVEFDASASVDPTGGACSQESGCASSNVLANYHWNFGDGSEADSASPTISHEFANAETTPVTRTVSLVVTSKDAVVSGPSEKAIEVQGAIPTSGPSCGGVGILGWGTRLQTAAQSIWGPVFQSSVCPGGPTTTYIPNSSNAGMRAWNYDGKRGSINTAVQFVGTDSAPNSAQITNITSVAGGAAVLTIPVAQTSIGIVANPPAGCEIEAITNKQLEQVFRGTLKLWSDLDTAEGTCGSPIVRVVREDKSPATPQLKYYLAKMFGGTLPCTVESWADLSPTSWPESCEGAGLSKVQRTGVGSDDSMVEAVNATAGGIGYAPATVLAGANKVLDLQNNGQVAASEAEFAPPTIAGDEANCTGASYTVPSGARQKNGEPAANIDWSGVFSARPAAGGSNYPLCVLTYDLAFRGYKAAGMPFSKMITTRDYLRWYVTTQGQEAIEGAGYAPLPATAESSHNVRGAAQYAAGKIKY